MTNSGVTNNCNIKTKITGHIYALIVITIWSITYVATDMLLAM